MKLENYQPVHVQFASNTRAFMAYCPITFIVMDTMLRTELVNILACPTCKGALIQGDDNASLLCTLCNRSYPIIEGIPILLPGQTTVELQSRCGTP